MYGDFKASIFQYLKPFRNSQSCENRRFKTFSVQPVPKTVQPNLKLKHEYTIKNLKSVNLFIFTHLAEPKTATCFAEFIISLLDENYVGYTLHKYQVVNCLSPKTAVMEICREGKFFKKFN